MKDDLDSARQHPLSRRQVLGLGGATAAAALIGAADDRDAVAGTVAPTTKMSGPKIELDAKPGPIAIDRARTVVLVVDMTNDFGSKGGMFERAGIDIAPIQRAVGPTARVLAAAREHGVKIVYLSMAYQPDLADVGPPESPNWRAHVQFLQVGRTVQAPDGSSTRILVRDNWGTRVLSELRPAAGEPVVYKTRYSGFYATELDQILRTMDARYLVITGCTTSVCVESTLRDAMFRDYSPILLADCAAEPIGDKLPRSNHDASLLVIETLLGWVSDSERFVRALSTSSA